jgi:hypothetical protein
MIFFHHKSGRKFIVFLFCFSLFFISSCIDTGKQKHIIKPNPETHSNHLLSTLSPRQYYVPERIILNLTDNPSVSQAVTWRTGTEVSSPQAQIALATEYSDFGEKAHTIHAVTETIKASRENTVNQHSVVFTSLKPNTLYAYRVGDGVQWSEWNHFKTACKTHEPFKFVYFGDIQDNVKSLCSRIFREAYKKAPDAGFWLFIGDLVDNGDIDEEWAELFDALGWIPRMTPMIFLPGNHEYPDKRFIQEKEYKLFHLWRPHFTLPENGPDDLKETVYFVDYQGVRFVMLNGNEKLEEQAKWLDTILSRNTQSWTIAAIHQPMYSTGKNRNNSLIQNLFIPVFDKYSVDLVLQGHDHTYSRTYKLRNGIRVANDKNGTVYIISVSGPKSYSINKQYENIMAKLVTGRQLFQVISIDKNRLKYESFDALGELHDSFELKK